MGDTTTSSIETLSRRFGNTQFENRVRRFGDTAREIVNGAEEPEAVVTEIAIAIIMEYEEITLDPAHKALKLPERIDLALENTTSLYENVLDVNVQEWQMRLGLKRGQQALFSANHVIFGRTTAEAEIGKLKRMIAARLERIEEHKRAAKDRKRAKAPQKKQTASTQPALEQPDVSNVTDAPPAPAKATTRKRSPKAAKPVEQPAS